jgi:hypothetical protein
VLHRMLDIKDMGLLDRETASLSATLVLHSLYFPTKYPWRMSPSFHALLLILLPTAPAPSTLVPPLTLVCLLESSTL